MGLPVTVGIVTVAVGETYQNFLPQWATAIANLERQPDQVTIVVDHIPEHYVKMLDEILGSWQLITTTTQWEHHPQILVNEAISVTQTEWICKMDADDIILPHAFNQIDTCEADILLYGIVIDKQGRMFNNVTSDMILELQHNYVFSGSPFRRWLWETNNYRDMIFEDWAFWIGCAKQTQKLKHTGTIDYIYTTHPHQISTRADADYWTEKVRNLK